MRLRARLARLEARLPPLPAEVPQAVAPSKERRDLARRLQDLLVQAAALMSQPDQERLAQALEAWDTLDQGPLRLWFIHLAKGWCRLPLLAGAVVKDLILAWLSPEREEQLSYVCVQCGLERPKHKQWPRQWKRAPGVVEQAASVSFFSACPGCAETQSDWAHQVHRQRRVWMDMDGCAGPPEPSPY